MAILGLKETKDLVESIISDNYYRSTTAVAELLFKEYSKILYKDPFAETATSPNHTLEFDKLEFDKFFSEITYATGEINKIAAIKKIREAALGGDEEQQSNRYNTPKQYQAEIDLLKTKLQVLQGKYDVLKELWVDMSTIIEDNIK